MSVNPRLPSPETELLVLATQNAELRLQLAEAQEHCIELAVDSGDLQAKIEALQAEIARLRGASASDRGER